eukprot:IDg13348t1
MANPPPSVFGRDSDEEEDEKVQARGRRALQVLQELRSEAQSCSAHLKSDEPDDDDDIAADDDDGEMARLRNSARYKQLQLLHARPSEKPPCDTQNRPSSAVDADDVCGDQKDGAEPDPNAAASDKLEANTAKRKRVLSGHKLNAKIADDSSDDHHSDDNDSDEEQLGPAGGGSERTSLTVSRESKRVRLATGRHAPSVAKRQRQSPPRRKIDPKIVDDSSDEDSSDTESDEEQLGPMAVDIVDEGADNLPLTHEAAFGSTHAGYVSGIALDGAGGRLHTGAHDGLMKLWDFNTMDWTLTSFGETSPLEGAALHGLTGARNGGRVLCWGALPHARVLDREGRALAQTPAGDMYLVDAARSKGHPGAVRSARWLRAEGSTLATVGTEGVVRIWDAADSRRVPMQSIPVMKQLTVTKLRNSRGGRAVAQALAALDDALVAVACDDRSVKILDVRARGGRPAQTAREVSEQGGEFTALEAAPDATGAPLLLARSTDDSLRVLDRRRLDVPLAAFDSLPNSISETSAIFIGASGTHFATGTSASRRDDTAAARVVIFSRTTMRQIATKEVPADAGSVICMHWHEKLNQIVYGCGDGSVRAMYDP